MNKTILGLHEEIEFKTENGSKKYIAKIDTGATNSSIDTRLASELRLGPVIESKFVKSAHGTRLRPVVEADIVLHGKHMKAKFTIADRSHLKFGVLIGVNVLKEGFLIDPSRDVNFKKD